MLFKQLINVFIVGAILAVCLILTAAIGLSIAYLANHWIDLKIYDKFSMLTLLISAYSSSVFLFLQCIIFSNKKIRG